MPAGRETDASKTLPGRMERWFFDRARKMAPREEEVPKDVLAIFQDRLFRVFRSLAPGAAYTGMWSRTRNPPSGESSRVISPP